MKNLLCLDLTSTFLDTFMNWGYTDSSGTTNMYVVASWMIQPQQDTHYSLALQHMMEETELASIGRDNPGS